MRDDGPGENKKIRLLKAATALPGRPTEQGVHCACRENIDDFQIRYATATHY